MKSYVISSEFLEVRFLDLGGRITSIYSPYFDGNLVLSYPDSFSGDGQTVSASPSYLTDINYLGAVAGRYANRISGGAFTLDGKEYSLDKNDNGTNCLHGGNNGYDKRIFEVESSYSTALLKLNDPENNFPGNVSVQIRYSVIGSSLMIQYLAKTDKPTVINLTNHSYFNPYGPLDDCEARFNSAFFTPIDDKMIPTGEIKSIKNTPFDFTEYKKIGRDIDCGDGQLEIAGGYDHNFVINGSGLRKAAEVYMPVTGIKLTVTTDMPGSQFYTGNFLKDPFVKREGFCLETQYYPDSPNKSGFPSCVATPEKPFRSKTIYSFTPERD